MRKTILFLIAGCLLVLSESSAEAQRRTPPRPAPARAVAPARVPNTDMWGVGGSIGIADPRHKNLDTGLVIAGNVEKYLTPRVSVRGQLGLSWWDMTGLVFAGTMKPFYIDGNIVYNWEYGVWHPYATGGLGFYRYGFTETNVADGSDSTLGVNLGGGVEYFIKRDMAVTGEALYHKVGDVETTRALFHTGGGSFITLMGGVKKYF